MEWLCFQQSPLAIIVPAVGELQGGKDLSHFITEESSGLRYEKSFQKKLQLHLDPHRYLLNVWQGQEEGLQQRQWASVRWLERVPVCVGIDQVTESLSTTLRGFAFTFTFIMRWKAIMKFWEETSHGLLYILKITAKIGFGEWHFWGRRKSSVSKWMQ